jgi:poly-gamma-glutamate synthesis protein (capsule biosynthesis protein)
MKLLIGADVVPTSATEELFVKGDARALFGKVCDLAKDADRVIINLEAALTNHDGKIKKFGPNIKGVPECTAGLKALGVTDVMLSNNHVFDFGETAFYDTLDTVDAAGLQRFGAGRDVDEARKPLYYIINGRKIAYIAGSRAEKNFMTPTATKTAPGVFGIYDDTMMCETIKEAKANADVVILFVHWGAENETYIEDIIRKQGKNYIDSGADVIIGAHAHNLQGVEFYKGKLIAYNIGNYLFNAKDRDTVLMSVEIDGDGEITSKMLPLKQKNCYLSMLSEKEQQRVRDHITSISVNGYVASDNVIREFIMVDF